MWQPRPFKVFQNLENALGSAGLSFNNVLEFTALLVGRDSLQAFVEIRTKIFTTIFPCTDYHPNTLMIIRVLVHKEFNVEIKAVAALS